uniref:pectinesterase n=1 Tax=Nelumbo nucifera TaxID=4432 RepID=A0A823A604_NELNU|nr:TPA_asm: hypothetical protein HUJ06_019135 [Nelumbo nucifera]
MDTVKSFKGYGKVDEHEDLEFRRKTRKRLIIISVSVILLLTIIVGAVVGTVIHKSKNDDDGQNEQTPSSSETSVAQSIKAVCSVTQYPNSCFSSLSSLAAQKTTDPEELFKLSLQVALTELSKLASLPTKLIPKVNGDPLLVLTLRDCQTQFEDAIDQLNMSISSMQVSQGEKLLSASKISDLRTWLSAAITNEQSCLDGLQELNSTTAANVLEELRVAMKNSTEFTSNSLAIVSKILTLLENLDIPIHRKLLDVGSDSDEFPAWMHPDDRRLLQETGVTPDVVVAKDGSGKYKTIEEAVVVVPKKSVKRFVIYVKAGMYVENVVVDKSKWNVMMYGDGIGKTIVSGRSNVKDGTPTFSTATFGK